MLVDHKNKTPEINWNRLWIPFWNYFKHMDNTSGAIGAVERSPITKLISARREKIGLGHRMT